LRVILDGLELLDYGHTLLNRILHPILQVRRLPPHLHLRWLLNLALPATHRLARQVIIGIIWGVAIAHPRRLDLPLSLSLATLVSDVVLAVELVIMGWLLEVITGLNLARGGWLLLGVLLLLVVAGLLERVILLLVGRRRLAGVFGELGSLIALLLGWLGLGLGHLRRRRWWIFDLIFSLIIKHVHEFLQNLLILAIHAHIDILVILSQSLFFIPT
jgi:hypothetical protein